MEELSVLKNLFAGAFALALILGAVAAWSNFCTMGAVSDWVNMGDKNRFRSWVLAMAVAMLGVCLASFAGWVDMSLTNSNETANPPYRTPAFVWLRYIVGGFLFGVGMTLGSGCGNKTLLRLGGGNLKSLFVLLAIVASASLMLFTSFDYHVFLQWMTPLAVEFSGIGAEGQDLGSIAAAVSGSENGKSLNILFGAVLSAMLMFWVFRSGEFRQSRELVIAGLLIGAVVAAAWLLTAGAWGQLVLEEVEFLDTRPYAIGAQSFTFVAPAGHAFQYVQQSFAPQYLTFALVAAAGVFFGALGYSLLFRKFRFEWFSSVGDFVNHLLGGVLMGIGGVLAMGCTVGQAITGISTLALGSFLTFGAIVLGSAVTMKYQYYRMLYEDAARAEVVLTVLAEVRLLPAGMRRLEAL